jgi:hypothetical protein
MSRDYQIDNNHLLERMLIEADVKAHRSASCRLDRSIQPGGYHE